MKQNFSKDPFTRNVAYLSALVFVLSMQVLIVLVFVYQFIPLKMAPITEGVPPTLLKLFHPNRNHFFYHAFIAAAIIGQALVLYIFRKDLGSPDLAGKIRKFLICETIWVSWQLFAVFKILQYDNPAWARTLLYAGFAVAVLAKIFWPELKRSLKFFQTSLGQDIPVLWQKYADAGIILVLAGTMIVPDTEKVLLRLAMVDNNNHFDQWLMAPLWAYHKGLIPVFQFFNPLNLGVLVLIHALANLIGGVTYGHVIAILCLLAVTYYTALYYFLRCWLGILPAAFGVLLAVKLQMFNIGVSPLIWVYPGESIVRHLFDVAVFLCLLLFARGQGEFFIWLAAAFIGISLACVFDSGVYLAGALYAYTAVLLFFKDTRRLLCPSPRQWRRVFGLILLPWFSMMIVLLLCFGTVVLHKEFWTESFKDIPRWLQGADAVSVYSCLRDRHFFAFFASFFPPLLYMAGITATVSMVYFRSWKSEKLFVIPLSVYGLGVYAHFLWHSTVNFYYLVPLPLVGCVCFWGTEYLEGKKWRREAKLILVIGALIALFTNVLFTYYPNVFNMAQEDWNQQKTIYRADFNFIKDAQFVRQETSVDQQVPLISSFATQILLQSDRKPFFKNGMALMGPNDVLQLTDQLDEQKPIRVFIDKKISNITGNDALNALINDLKNHYQYTGKQSDRLILLQRNS